MVLSIKEVKNPTYPNVNNEKDFIDAKKKKNIKNREDTLLAGYVVTV